MPWTSFIDILLVAVAAITQAATGILGWRVTTHELTQKQKNIY